MSGTSLSDDGFACIKWLPEDVVVAFEKRGQKVTIEQATEWLINNSGHIEDRSVEYGWDVIDCLIDLDPIENYGT